ncbi:hypothetical protein HJA82_29185 [Rhizobium bangladeshense]|uniref:hypothetical protein n=1 Tax=Rhizobium TaxID=379 RepID=UPI001C83FBF1|nr:MULTISPECIES: hypothetical protein [Rhizobium]MBX4911389.1 hypothetical protein [Rhizobium bangladeshense]MBX5130684.1 hypothetical protein [Rhizobium lentis]
MTTLEFAGDLLSRVSRMRLKDWEAAKPDLIEEIRVRDDMAELFQEFTLKTVEECRCRVIIRRAYKKRYGMQANVAHAETTTHLNFGRF